MEIINDYLSPDINQIRHSILGIDDSYNNTWDIYAELTQNAIDAIRTKGSKGRINISVDCSSRTITIADNGVGISADELPSLLKPFSTNKKDNDVTIGEKGVGLKFVIFSSNKFSIKSGNGESAAEAVVSNANSWKKSTANESLPLQFHKLEERFEGTVITVEGVDNQTLFDLTFEQFKYILLTRTALGSTQQIWEDDVDIEILLEYVDINSQSHKESIPFKYWLITDHLPSTSKISLEEFQTWLDTGDKGDQEKVSKLKDKVIYDKGEFVHSNNRKLKYCAIFVPQRKIWRDLSIRFHLATEEQLEDETWIADNSFCVISNGIFLSVKGMPTGISVSHPSTGYAGYWSNLFIIFEDPFLKFDIGRKSVHGRQATIHQRYAKEIFSKFLRYVTKYVTGDLVVEPTEWDRDEIFSDVENLVDLNIDGINFQKTPSDQEASVAAIFFLAMGNGKIKDLTPIISGYRNRYDLYVRWGKKKKIFEFKAHLRNLAKDFNDARKMFDEIDCVVCWEVTDKDKQVMKDMGVNVDEISESLFASEQKVIPNSTHIMNLSGFINPIYVIDLKRHLTKSER